VRCAPRTRSTSCCRPLPGYGFSGQPTEIGWDTGRVARAWAELMHRLGHTRYVAQGGDVGAVVTDALGRQAPAGLVASTPTCS
jgi:pimeloyl-ACP methyl ester carboxylesterase